MYDVWDRQELLFKIKLLQDRVDAFESGRKYSVMVKEHKIARESDFRVMERQEGTAGACGFPARDHR